MLSNATNDNVKNKTQMICFQVQRHEAFVPLYTFHLLYSGAHLRNDVPALSTIQAVWSDSSVETNGSHGISHLNNKLDGWHIVALPSIQYPSVFSGSGPEGLNTL